jgi:hypothetical protein
MTHNEKSFLTGLSNGLYMSLSIWIIVILIIKALFVR